MVSMSVSLSLSPMSGAMWCKPHLGPSASQDQTLVLAGLASSLLQPKSKIHHHQVMGTSYVCSRKAPCPMDVNS